MIWDSDNFSKQNAKSAHFQFFIFIQQNTLCDILKNYMYF